MPKTGKRYRALRDIIRDLMVPEGYVIIPGRQRDVYGSLSVVYVDVVRVFVDGGSIIQDRRRYYFDHKPTPQSVGQVVDMMIELMEER